MIRKQHSLGLLTSFATGAHAAVAESSDLIPTGFSRITTILLHAVRLCTSAPSTFDPRLGIILQCKSQWQLQDDASFELVVNAHAFSQRWHVEIEKRHDVAL